MKISLFCFDFFHLTIEQLISDGHEISRIYGVDTDNTFSFNNKTREISERLNIKYSTQKPSAGDLLNDMSNGVELFLSLGYPHKIPTVSGLHGLNLHPTLLPMGRGAFPVPWLILESPQYSGLTVHKITEKWDSGDILAQIPVEVSFADSLLLVCAKLQIAAAPFVSTVLRNYGDLAAKAVPQGEGLYWNATPNDWTIKWTDSLEVILRKVRAFGALDVVVVIDGKSWLVSRAEGWMTPHGHRAGKMLHCDLNGMLVATLDGYVLLQDVRPDEEGT